MKRAACARLGLVGGVASLWIAAHSAHAQVPVSPCEDLPGVSAALERAAKAEGNALEVEIAQLEQRAGTELVHETGSSDPEARARLAHRRLKAWCELLSRLDATGGAHATVASAADPKRLQAILDRPEFEGARDRHGDSVGSLLRRLFDWFTALLNTDSARSFGAFSRLVRVLVLTLAVALVILVGIRISRARRGGRGSMDAVASAHAPLNLEDPATHLGHARAALGRDPRTAIREGLLALLSMLERRRWARPDRVKTNRELAAELPKRGAPAEIAEQVEGLVRWYDRSFYSLAPIAREEAERFVDEVARFEARLPGGAA